MPFPAFCCAACREETGKRRVLPRGAWLGALTIGEKVYLSVALCYTGLHVQE